MRRGFVCHSNSVAPSVQLADIVARAGTALPGIPHSYRVCRAYRQWLKIAVLCPPSALCELNEHMQMNERFVIIVRQKFHEGAGLRDPEQIAVAVQSSERSLTMFRFLAADGARRRFPEAKPRLNLHKMGFMEMAKINYMQMVKEYWNTYVMRRW
ncbi:putative Complex 1 protein (LYR family) [Trypanosoma vivax]|uniref:Uncharacterized protein n=1 Tax=Trypanosoma vivax (strain Y486) TaxID=1055687 RepID=G0TSB5_TRYVY|nr:hypothetical protein TRVL_04570 [Trypanosoma vivax]KAH8605444.1 putative Complex 1 protein (LYR family) [Trypanosoma vivax]CCC46841.1 conserved hypothetical protein [Trypanosoma vivax Y486]